MKRLASALLVTALALGLTTGCRRTVEVQSGARVMCTYGHTISDEVRTIRVPVKDAAENRIVTETRTCDRHLQAEEIYADAQNALADGDMDAAKSKLAEVVKLDGAFGSAREQLDAIAQGKKVEPDGSVGNAGGAGAGGGAGGTRGAGTGAGAGNGASAPKPDPTPGLDDTSTPAGGLARFTPDALSGYKASKPIVDPLQVTRSYAPAGSGGLFQLIIVAEQFHNSEAAQRAVTALRSQYPQGWTKVTVEGKSVQYGTDAKTFAIMAFTDGAVMVAAEGAAAPGQSVSAVKAPLAAVLGQLR